ncbi:MAG: glycosyltransferase, partial [Chitinophagaceae bacterium]
KVDGTLWICGEGNYTNSCKTLIKDHNLEEKVIMMGMLLPEELKKMTTRASIGINLVEPIGLNQIYSLANKFFDYIHAGIPQITMDFPEYRKINDEFEVAVLIEKPEVEIIADALNNLIRNMVLYQRLEFNCHRASTELNWQKESEKLNQFFPKIKN